MSVALTSATLAMIAAGAALLSACSPPTPPTGAPQIPKLGYDAALAKGVEAAKAQQFAQAADYFRQAHDANPAAPEPLFDLGLAEAKISGRDLRAMAWFEAYLALAPGAPNAAAVRQQIKNLDTAAQTNAAALTKIVASVPTDDTHTELCDGGYLAGASGNAGLAKDEFAGCRKHFSDGAPEGLAKAGHFDEALALAQKMEPADRRYALYTIALQATQVGALTEGKRAIDMKSLIDNDDNAKSTTTWLKLRLAVVAYQTGQTADASALIEIARNDLALRPNSENQSALASTLYRTGNMQDADTIFRNAVADAQRQSDLGKKMGDLVNVGMSAYILGHPAEATALFNQANDTARAAQAAGKIVPSGTILTDELEVGDWADARAWIDADDYPGDKPIREKLFRDAQGDRAMDRILDPQTPQDQRVIAWKDYVDAGLGDPIFMDFASIVQSSNDAKSVYGLTGLNKIFLLYKPYVDRLAEIRVAESIAAR